MYMQSKLDDSTASYIVLSHLNFGILLGGYKCEKVFKLQKKLLEF